MSVESSQKCFIFDGEGEGLALLGKGWGRSGNVEIVSGELQAVVWSVMRH
jgi:hypothetical protein